jgi:hypothetical protein
MTDKVLDRFTGAQWVEEWQILDCLRIVRAYHCKYENMKHAGKFCHDGGS